MAESVTVDEQAESFAADVTDLVRIVAPEAESFRVTRAGRRLVVKQQESARIPLTVDGVALLYLFVQFFCEADSFGQHLAVAASRFQVSALKPGGNPLFRYEYQRDAHSAPSSHLHVHAHRDALTYMMARGGENSLRARSRRSDLRVPSMEDIHFPLGGSRFRPGLEDIVEMLIDEFGVDTPGLSAADARSRLVGVRAQWRRVQTRAAVRGAPRDAADVLRSLGYQVEWPGEEPEPSERPARLQAR